MYDFIKLIIYIIFIFLVALMFAAPIGLGIIELKEAQCTQKYSEYEPQFGILSGCRVVWEGKLTPVENIGYRDMQ